METPSRFLTCNRALHISKEEVSNNSKGVKTRAQKTNTEIPKEKENQGKAMGTQNTLQNTFGGCNST
jgi:hypothetical protein